MGCWRARESADRRCEIARALNQTCPEASKVGTVEIKTPLLPNPLTARCIWRRRTRTRSGRWSRCTSSRKTRSRVCSSSSRAKSARPGDGAARRDVREHAAAAVRRPRTALLRWRTRAAGDARAVRRLHDAGVDRAVVGQRSRRNSSSTLQDHLGPERRRRVASPLPFAPSLTAGTTNIQAGGFTPFTMTMSREDGQQNLQAIAAAHAAGPLGALDGREAVRRSRRRTRGRAARKA